MEFRKGKRKRKGKRSMADLGHGNPSRVTSLSPKRGRPVRTKGKTHKF